MLTKPQAVEFQRVVEPVIKWLAENVHPHHTVVVTNTRAELLEGQRTVYNDTFIKG